MNQQRVEGQAGQVAVPCVSPAFAQLRDSFQFLRGFVRNPAQVGSIIPSSRQLEQRLVRSARISDARMVVELGPGTGGTTSAFLRAMMPTAQLLAIELDTEFHHRLHASIHDPRFSLELGSAERLDEFLKARWLPAPDAIISGIPFSTMPAGVSDRVASSVARVLRPGGRFVAYQVRAHVSGFMSPYLGTPEKKWEIANVPPVRVFTWTKPEA
ncbi:MULTISPECIES: class I SAM-dependent methyltransferase [unclassified Polaromonas]|jgi:phospholipid N-methyltransferase|uniref:class I SAM-dependent methyltransferase n=1 Tax=unclassified Polaromonas TaxID=2638319 RepID=UPI0018CA51E7|nr:MULTISPECIES: methyltransferase domain-containing protein [unclassified Polaromonas]MBG6071309.1 phospholipid N-methyltransferase [Polaromonas sp. CG_9.7]MBG6113309.1 phospholipid N-methyltransferase [Polaromonas sp. CG_9.2]MDH6183236.1 phospholipid N-methyltransferase [Polaromonas sp. CG_23.6]